MALRIPRPESVSGPVSMSSRGPMAVEDTSGLQSGIQALAQGVDQLSGSLGRIDAENTRKKNVADIAVANNEWLKQRLDLENRLYQDPAGYRDHVKTAGDELTTMRADIAARITDPDSRQEWMLNAEEDSLRFVDGIGDRAYALQTAEDRSNFVRALDDTSKLIAEPGTDETLRQKARADLTANIGLAQQEGLILPGEAEDYRRKYVDGTESQLAVNRATLEMMANPQGLSTKLGVSTSMGGNTAAASAIQSSPNGIVAIDPGVAAQAAETLGDTALPSDPKLRAAYLSDPKVNAKYTVAAMDLLTNRYKGDLAAATIASAGGTALADAWVQSKKNDSILPAKVRTYYKSVVQNMTPVADYAPLPVIAGPGVDLGNMDVAVLDRFEKLQGAFGQQLVVISGFRDPQHNADVGGADHSQHMERRALDIDVSKLSKEDRVRFIEMASAAGFTGIGVYNNSIHLDTGSRRAWGSDYHKESIPGWAADVLTQHVAGKITSAPPTIKGVAPEYSALTFDQRASLYHQAQQEASRQNVDMQAGIAVAVQNAPAAVAMNGTYTGDVPEASDFVQAYGAAEGIARYKDFQTNMDISEAKFGMRTMSADDIHNMVNSIRPKSTGDEAAAELERFDAVSKAASQILDQREKDPAGYVLQTYPDIGQAFNIDATNPDGTAPTDQQKSDRMARALTMMSTAQDHLGIDNQVLLPKDMATSVASTFNNTELSQDDRMGALTSMVFRTQDEGQQEAIMQQLVAAGVPPEAEAAVAALARDDRGAAAYLFRAVMTKTDDLPLPDNETPSGVRKAIDDAVFDDGELGDVIYGLNGGTAENYDRFIQDRALFEKAVRLRLAESSISVDQAVELTKKDMWGDVRPVIDRNMQITLPTDEDSAPWRNGFGMLLSQVRSALSAAVTPTISGASNSKSEAAVLTAARDNGLDVAMSEGYFANFGRDEYVFIDPRTGQSVTDADGSELTFTKEDVMQAAATATSLTQSNMPMFVTAPLGGSTYQIPNFGEP